MNYKAKGKYSQKGFSLIELMIALVLGLILMAGILSVFSASVISYRVNENLARMQEDGRITFEILSRELRGAGDNLCGAKLLSIVVIDYKNYWWADWSGPFLTGFDDKTASSIKAFGTSQGDRVSGSDALLLRSGAANEGVTIVKHNPNAARFEVNTKNHGLSDGDIVMVCDNNSAAITQLTNTSTSNTNIVHNTGNSVSPGNCTKLLGYPAPDPCTATTGPLDGTSKSFEEGALITRLSASFWYMGVNGRGSHSLYRISMNGSSKTTTQEVASGISDMQVKYLTSTAGVLADDFVDADSVADWEQVVALRISLTFGSEDSLKTGQKALQRKMVHVISLRNKETVN